MALIDVLVLIMNCNDLVNSYNGWRKRQGRHVKSGNGLPGNGRD